LLFAGKSKEAEVKRINRELANIRSKFKGLLWTVFHFRKYSYISINV